MTPSSLRSLFLLCVAVGPWGRELALDLPLVVRILALGTWGRLELESDPPLLAWGILALGVFSGVRVGVDVALLVASLDEKGRPPARSFLALAALYDLGWWTGIETLLGGTFLRLGFLFAYGVARSLAPERSNRPLGEISFRRRFGVLSLSLLLLAGHGVFRPRAVGPKEVARIQSLWREAVPMASGLLPVPGAPGSYQAWIEAEAGGALVRLDLGRGGRADFHDPLRCLRLRGRPDEVAVSRWFWTGGRWHREHLWVQPVRILSRFEGSRFQAAALTLFRSGSKQKALPEVPPREIAQFLCVLAKLGQGVGSLLSSRVEPGVSELEARTPQPPAGKELG